MHGGYGGGDASQRVRETPSMWAQLTPALKQQARRLLLTLTLISVLFGRAIRRGWQVVRPTVVFALNVLAALILLFEEWGWRPLSNLVAQLARFPIWAAVERWIAGLPPYGALLTLAVPSTIVIPTKLIGVYLLATGHFLTATAVIICAKIVGTALVARIFILTKPQLMRIGWFQSSYDTFVPWQEALFARIRNSFAWRYGRVVRWRAKGYVRRAYSTLRPKLDDALKEWKPRTIAWAQRMQVVGRQAGERGLVISERLLRRVHATARSLSERAADKGERLLRRLQGPEA
jgi:hypothetical protein